MLFKIPILKLSTKYKVQSKFKPRKIQHVWSFLKLKKIFPGFLKNKIAQNLSTVSYKGVVMKQFMKQKSLYEEREMESRMLRLSNLILVCVSELHRPTEEDPGPAERS